MYFHLNQLLESPDKLLYHKKIPVSFSPFWQNPGVAACRNPSHREPPPRSSMGRQFLWLQGENIGGKEIEMMRDCRLIQVGASLEGISTIALGRWTFPPFLWTYSSLPSKGSAEPSQLIFLEMISCCVAQFACKSESRPLRVKHPRNSTVYFIWLQNWKKETVVEKTLGLNSWIFYKYASFKNVSSPRMSYLPLNTHLPHLSRNARSHLRKSCSCLTYSIPFSIQYLYVCGKETCFRTFYDVQCCEVLQTP